MSRDWNDDEQNDPAPLPAHERAWRHPSEVGERAWVYSEPPLTIGRGLTAATGAIGGLLAMAVLWTMLPTQAGRNVVAIASSTVVELTGMYRFLFQSHPQLMLEFGAMTALLYLAMSYPLSLVARRMETRFKQVAA